MVELTQVNTNLQCQGITEAQKILVQLKDLHPTVRKSMSIGITPENTVTSPCGESAFTNIYIM